MDLALLVENLINIQQIKTANQNILWPNIFTDRDFKEIMEDTVYCVIKYFRGNKALINMMVTISFDYDLGRYEKTWIKEIDIFLLLNQ